MSQGEGQDVIFDWRKYAQLIPLEDDPREVTDLYEHPDLYPKIHGKRYTLPVSNLAIILLTKPSSEKLKMQWYYPFSPNLWSPASCVEEIYSTSRIDLNPDSPVVGNLTLRYAGKEH